jgi:hypothetical protein
MGKIQEKVSLKDLFKEVRALRRDVSVFMPMDSVDGYKNKKDIVSAYRDARRHILHIKSA